LTSVVFDVIISNGGLNANNVKLNVYM